MNIMCKMITPFRCQKCNQDTLFFLTRNNTLIDYKGMFNRTMTLEEMKEFLQDKRIRYIKCISCNKTFIIDWTDGYPQALLDPQVLTKFGV